MIVGAAIGLWAALALAIPASLRPINLNLPPPAPPAQAPGKQGKPSVPFTPTPPPSWRPAWLPTWLIPDRISVPTRKGACGWGFHNGCSAGTKR
jgi:hypothetical protein